ncbi:GNAT family N-acetyltransferase [Lysinibacillus sp. NPDC056232]|uniref:GNAT family N-acetyltransferase n=1 Tax=Lysinibacillus sp. NPDC056232 TaxID=3345756 RepID=UPI0035DAE2A5
MKGEENLTEKIKIRVPYQEDAEALLEIQQEVLAEEDYLITTIDEFQRTIDEQREWIQAKITNERETIFIAQYQEEIVGWLVFQSPQRKRLAHTGTFGFIFCMNHIIFDGKPSFVVNHNYLKEYFVNATKLIARYDEELFPLVEHVCQEISSFPVKEAVNAKETEAFNSDNNGASNVVWLHRSRRKFKR